MLSLFIAEFIGTGILIVFGAGVVANVVLSKTKGQNSGWIVITFGWAMAVYFGVIASVALGGPGHLNPAVTIAMVATDQISTDQLLPLIGGQFAGAIVASFIVFAAYKQHFDETEDQGLKLAVFATAPAIRSTTWNLATEIIGTFILVFGASLMSKENIGQLGPLPVGLLVLAIGLSLGGPTGYAINPARDLGPRIAHALLPIKNKGTSDWGYSWIPVVGPIIGAVLGALLFKQL